MTSKIIVVIVAVFAVLSLAAPVDAQERNCEVEYELVDSYPEKSGSTWQVVTVWDVTLVFMREGGIETRVWWWIDIQYSGDEEGTREETGDFIDGVGNGIRIFRSDPSVRHRQTTTILTKTGDDSFGTLYSVLDRDGFCSVY